MRISDWSSDVCSSDLREAAAEPLGRGQDVGRHLRPFVRPQLAAAAHAALHLVEDQQQAELVGDLAQRPQVVGAGRVHAALALHRLDQDRRGVVGDGGAHFVEVAEGNVAEALDAWRSEEHTSELQSLMRISYAVFCLKKQNLTKI